MRIKHKLSSEQVIAEHMMPFIRDGTSILVHGYSNVVIFALAAAAKSGVRFKVDATLSLSIYIYIYIYFSLSPSFTHTLSLSLATPPTHKHTHTLADCARLFQHSESGVRFKVGATTHRLSLAIFLSMCLSHTHKQTHTHTHTHTVRFYKLLPENGSRQGQNLEVTV